MKLSEVGGNAPADAPDAQKRLKLSDVWDQAKGSPAGAGEEKGSALGALWEGLKRGIVETGQGAAQLASRMPTLLPGAAAGQQRMQADIDQRITQGTQAYNASPQRIAHPLAAGIGRIGGNVLATSPLAALPLGAASIPGRLAMGAAGGAMGAAAMPAQGDYWAEKAKQVGIGAGMGAAVSGTGRLMGPPLSQAAQDAISKFPHIAPLVRGDATVFRTPDAFNRAAVNQALDPIGAVIPPTVKAGHGLIQAAEDRFTDAYNQVLPKLSVNGDPQLIQELANVKADTGRMSDERLSQLNKFLQNHLEKYFTPGAPLDGTQIKRIESDLGRMASSHAGGGADDQAFAGALYDAREAFMDAVARQNPRDAPELQRVNQAYAMFTRVQAAASRRADSRGVFSAQDLLSAARSLDKTARHGNFARGGAAMQAVGEAALGPMSAPKVNRILTEILGGAAGMAAGGPLGGAAGTVAGIAGPEIAKGVVRATQTPAARVGGAAVSALAPGAGAATAENRRSYVRMGHETEPPP